MNICKEIENIRKKAQKILKDADEVIFELHSLEVHIKKGEDEKVN